jgi:hypothetical protein
MVWFGVSIEKHIHWTNPAVASAVAAFGVQVLTSIWCVIHARVFG